MRNGSFFTTKRAYKKIVTKIYETVENSFLDGTMRDGSKFDFIIKKTRSIYSKAV